MNDENRAWGCALAIVAALVIVFGGGYWFLKTNTYTETGVVTALTWQRDINVDVYRQQEETARQGAQPADAYDLVAYTRTWTTYSEMCSGIGKDKTCTQYPQF